MIDLCNKSEQLVFVTLQQIGKFIVWDAGAGANTSARQCSIMIVSTVA